MVVLKNMKNSIDDASNTKAPFKEAKNEYIDLGLPSGKLWKFEPEIGYFTYDEAKEIFGRKLPSRKDFIELIKNTTREWGGRARGMIFTGKNGNSITLPATGYRKDSSFWRTKLVSDYWSAGDYLYDSSINLAGSVGNYWSSTVRNATKAYCLNFNDHQVDADYFDDRSLGCAIILVK